MRRDPKRARDLLAQLPRLLEPRPERVQFSVCIKGDSNYHSFLKCIKSKLEKAESEPVGLANDKPSNRELYSQWVRLLVDALLPEFRNEHRGRLALLSELYKLAYGGILEDLHAYDRLKTLLQTDVNEVLAGCIRDCLLRHSELDLPTQCLSLTDLTEASIERIRNQTFDGGEKEGGHVRFLLLRSACLLSNGS